VGAPVYVGGVNMWGGVRFGCGLNSVSVSGLHVCVCVCKCV
jgi:hypothetical protein